MVTKLNNDSSMGQYYNMCVKIVSKDAKLYMVIIFSDM